MPSSTTKNTPTAADVFARYAAKTNEAFAATLHAASARDKARSNAADLRQRLAHGDSTVSAADLIAADAECERAELLSQSADGNLTFVRNRAPVQPTVANVIRDAVGAALRAPVQIVEKFPTETPDTLPVAFLRQAKPSEHDLYEGRLSGRVELRYVRSDLHANIDADKLEKKLTAAGYQIKVNDHGSRGLADGIEGQDLLLVISAAYPDVPEIKGDLQDFQVRKIGGALASAIRERSRTIGNDGKVTASVEGFAKLINMTEDDGVRHAVVQVSINSTSSKRWYTVAEMATHVKSETEAMSGRAFEGVGRCTSVDLDPVATYSGDSVHAKAKLVFVSKAAQ